METRGERNNNPGNIRKNDTIWKGLTPDQSGDNSFCQFTSPLYGIRALARVLHAYYHLHGLNTVRKIIGRWAPPSENDTEAYISNVAHQAGVGADNEIDLDDPTIMSAICKAIIVHENGHCIYDDGLISDAVTNALGEG